MGKSTIFFCQFRSQNCKRLPEGKAKENEDNEDMMGITWDVIGI